ncbi:hypothetical protein [Devosia sp. A449]
MHVSIHRQQSFDRDLVESNSLKINFFNVQEAVSMETPKLLCIMDFLSGFRNASRVAVVFATDAKNLHKQTALGAGFAVDFRNVESQASRSRPKRGLSLKARVQLQIRLLAIRL